MNKVIKLKLGSYNIDEAIASSSLAMDETIASIQQSQLKEGS